MSKKFAATFEIIVVLTVVLASFYILHVQHQSVSQYEKASK